MSRSTFALRLSTIAMVGVLRGLTMSTQRPSYQNALLIQDKTSSTFLGGDNIYSICRAGPRFWTMGNIGVEADVTSRSTFALPLYHGHGRGVEGFGNDYPTMAIISQCTFAPTGQAPLFWVGDNIYSTCRAGPRFWTMGNVGAGGS